ncbi:LysR family transcriptional regulator [Streptomyces albiflavescens]|uniref:LysR family transcriptional regulator n=1 Tax=Streptomyces albiflavescens TaxID=1623582 RepID=A0A917Y7R6_9ACTN|nr:LysR family transcriptional regulator [Streptomyces albiflavescens]GGN75937.1 LysR family transcriptional regulator [Streptomyces albiflavescens]
MQQSSDVAAPLPDMNLLPALDALLRSGSVAGAAAELNVSPSAMSRTLGRLRRVVGDPLLVPSGRGLTLTPRAHDMQPRVQAALAAAVAALRPPREVDLATLQREFRIRTNDGVAMSLGAPLLELAAREAPGVRLRLLPEGEEDPADLRTHVDLDVGELPDPLPHDVRCSALHEHRMVAVARGDAEFAREPLTPDRFAALPHITVTRRGRARSVVDDRLGELGLHRDVLATAPTYGAACFFALRTDALALVPSEVAQEASRVMPLAVLDIPLDLPLIPSGQAWHVRLDADPAHRWLRGALERVAARITPAAGAAPAAP